MSAQRLKVSVVMRNSRRPMKRLSIRDRKDLFQICWKTATKLAKLTISTCMVTTCSCKQWMASATRVNKRMPMHIDFVVKLSNIVLYIYFYYCAAADTMSMWIT